MGILGHFYRKPWKVGIDNEVDEELAFHLEMRTREFVARGLSPDDARREAERRLGNPQAIRTALRTIGVRRDRHLQRTQFMSEFWQDVTFTARQFWKNPGFAAIAILTLTLGIGGTTAIFSALYAVVLRPLPLREPDRLFAVGETNGGQLSPMSVGIYVDAEAGTDAFDGLAALQYANYNLADGATPERVIGGKVTANYFEVMGTVPLVGRTFTPSEDQPGADRVVVISYRLWQRRFGGAPLVGREIRLNATGYTVLGIMPSCRIARSSSLAEAAGSFNGNVASAVNFPSGRSIAALNSSFTIAANRTATSGFSTWVPGVVSVTTCLATPCCSSTSAR